jgi:hypothetical protein
MQRDWRAGFKLYAVKHTRNVWFGILLLRSPRQGLALRLTADGAIGRYPIRPARVTLLSMNSCGGVTR